MALCLQKLIWRWRTLALTATAAGALAGCASDTGGGGDALRIGHLLFQTISGQGDMITRETAAQIPYASIGVQLGSSSQGLAVLGKGVGDDRYWYSGTRILFVTREGRLLETVGLPYDLTHVDIRGPNGDWVAPGTAEHFSMVFDFQDLSVFNAVAECTDTDQGPETITILNTNIQTHHHVEDCNLDQLDWSFENDFWIDPKTGYVWQSVQHPHPRSSDLTITVFRPESTPAPATTQTSAQ